MGGLPFLSVSACFVAAFQEANVSFSWDLRVVIALLAVSDISLLAFIAWEWFASTRIASMTPVLSWVFAQRRSLGLFM